MTHVEAPSSIMHRWTKKFRMETETWNAKVEGRRGSDWSKSNVINCKSFGLIAPMAESKVLHCEGQFFKTSNADMAVGDWANSSTML